MERSLSRKVVGHSFSCTSKVLEISMRYFPLGNKRIEIELGFKWFAHSPFLRGNLRMKFLTQSFLQFIRGKTPEHSLIFIVFFVSCWRRWQVFRFFSPFFSSNFPPFLQYCFALLARVFIATLISKMKSRFIWRFSSLSKLTIYLCCCRFLKRVFCIFPLFFEDALAIFLTIFCTKHFVLSKYMRKQNTQIAHHSKAFPNPLLELCSLIIFLLHEDIATENKSCIQPLPYLYIEPAYGRCFHQNLCTTLVL